MENFEFRLCRRELGFTHQQYADSLGVSLRTCKYYQGKAKVEIPRKVIMAVKFLLLKNTVYEFESLTRDEILIRLKTICSE